MSNDTIIPMNLSAHRDALSALLQTGPQQLIYTAVQEELQEFLESHRDKRDPHGRQAVVRNGYQPKRKIVTGIGAVEVRCLSR